MPIVAVVCHISGCKGYVTLHNQLQVILRSDLLSLIPLMLLILLLVTLMLLLHACMVRLSAHRLLLLLLLLLMVLWLLLRWPWRRLLLLIRCRILLH